MKKFFTTKYLPWVVLAAGILGAICRGWLFSSGLDDKGLLVSNHFAHWALWLLSIAVAAVLILGTRKLKQAPKYSYNFPGSILGALGAAAAGIALAFSNVLTLLPPADGLSSALCFLGVLGGIALCVLGYCRWKGSHPSTLLHAVLCVYFMLHLVYQYRLWSADPQLQDYLFSLLALVFTLLSCYYSANFTINEGNRRVHTIVHLAGVYCCLVSLPRCDAPVLFAAIALWLFTNLCSLTAIRSSCQKEEG